MEEDPLMERRWTRDDEPTLLDDIERWVDAYERAAQSGPEVAAIVLGAFRAWAEPSCRLIAPDEAEKLRGEG